MGAVDYILLAALGLAVFLAARWAWGRHKKGGSCCGSCAGCSGCCKSCHENCPDQRKEKK